MLKLIVIAALSTIAVQQDDPVARVRAAIAHVRSEIAALPPARDDSERLIRLGRLDEAPRTVIMATDFSKIPETQRQSSLQAISEMVDTSDQQNQRELLELMPPSGWFTRSKYGEKASGAAFLIVQHSGPRLWKEVLPRLEPLVRTGEVEGQEYGLMFDREAVVEGRPQRYGTQFRCDGGKWRPYPIEDPRRLEQRRSELNFVGTFAETKAHFDASPPCLQTKSPPPSGMKLD